ncbi:MAG: transglycosylase SLT domain-containing protein, partial [Gammaproteobacteria bacterium]
QTKVYYTVMKFYRWLPLCAVCALIYPYGFALGSVFVDDQQEGAPSSISFSGDYTQERMAFWEAGKALKSGKLERYQQLLDGLQDYPLVGYLRYEYLRTRLDTVSDNEVEEFLQRYADSSISARLRSAWFDQLAGEGRWEAFLKTYQNAPGEQGVVAQCYALEARYRTLGSQPVPQDWLDATQSLWLTGKTLPDECNTLFKIWRSKAPLTKDLIWQRIRLAMDNRQASLAGSLAKDLDAPGKIWAARWQRMYDNPERMIDHPDYSSDVSEARDIVRHGIKRLARNDASIAAGEWERLKPRYSFSAAEIGATERDIALAAALQRKPDALKLLSAVDASQVDSNLREWRVRAAVAQQDWPAVLTWVEALEGDERTKGDWRYWHARALEQLKSPAALIPSSTPQSESSNQLQAEQIYSELAKERTYYGFMANDRLGKSYRITSEPIQFSKQEIAAFAARPNLVRVHELEQLGMLPEAYSEWEYILKSLNQRDLELAAVLAKRWGWHSRAIFTSAKANHRDDLELRFPTLFRPQVMASAKQNELDPAWVYGVIRQESAFSTDARSSAGALGLMQLMPATGKQTAKLIKSPLRDLGELLHADKNIQLGSAYLRQVLGMNNGNEMLATASYNAGPARVRQWLPIYDKMPADVWVENVPFTETRNYIQQVMAFTTIFSHQLGQEIVSLRKRMPDVKPSDE